MGHLSWTLARMTSCPQISSTQLCVRMVLGTQKQTIYYFYWLFGSMYLSILNWHKVVFLHLSALALNIPRLFSAMSERRSLKNFVLLFHDFFKANRLKVKLGREQHTYILFWVSGSRLPRNNTTWKQPGNQNWRTLSLTIKIQIDK